MQKQLLIFILVFSAAASFAQNGNFRTRSNGGWLNTSAWERDADADGIFEESPSTLSPSFTDGSILIRSGHRINIGSAVVADQLTIESGGSIVFSGGGSLQIADGDGSDLVNSGKVITTTNNQLQLLTNAQYEHNQNGGLIPLATWQSGSTCLVTGVMDKVVSFEAGTAFQNFSWNCAAQSTNIHFGGYLNNVQGTLTVTNTNNFILYLANNTAPGDATFGNLVVSGSARFAFSNSASFNVNIPGTFTYTSTHPTGSTLKSGGIVGLTMGSFEMNAPGGTLNFSAGSGGMTVNLAGNFTHTAGLMTTVMGSSTLVFDGISEQTFVSAGTIQSFSYRIMDGASVFLPGENAFVGNDLVVNGELRLGSTNSTGAIVTGTTLGNVRTTTRTFNSGSRIVFAGSGTQYIGNGHPTGTGITTEVDNPAGVVFSSTITGNSSTRELTLCNLELTNGNLNIESTSSVTRVLIINGNIQADNGVLALSGPNVNVTVNGTGNLNFPTEGSLSIRNFTINRSAGAVSVNGALNVPGALTISAGILDLNNSGSFNAVAVSAGGELNFAGQTVVIRKFTSTGGFLAADASSSLTLNGEQVNVSPIAFSPTANQIGTLTVHKGNTTGTSAVIDSEVTVTSELKVSKGQLEIVNGALQMAEGALLTLSSNGIILGSSPSGGPWAVKYTDNSVTTGFEVPASGILSGLQISTTSGSTLTFDQDVTVQSLVTVPVSRSLICGLNNVSFAGLTNNGSITAPGSTGSLSILGDFTNQGTFNRNGGSISLSGNWANFGTVSGTGDLAFTGNTSIVAGEMPSFVNLTVSGVFNSPLSTLSIAGNLHHDGTLNGVNTLIFNGVSPQLLSGTSPLNVVDINVLNISEPVSLNISGIVNLSGKLTLTENAVVDADGEDNAGILTLMSTSEGTASIGQLTGTSAIHGKVTVERYLPAADNIAWYISSPVAAPPVTDLQDDFPVTGAFTGSSFPCTGCELNGANVKWYREADKGAFNNGYKPLPAGSSTNAEPMIAGRGYEAFMWNGVSPTVLDLRDSINQGLFTFSVTHTATGNADADGWNLIGNPFPSSITWSEQGWTRSANIDPTVWMWDVLNNQWLTYDYTSSEPQTLDGGIIASGQGFWVYVTPGTATLQISEEAKTEDLQGNFYRKNINSKSAGIELTISGMGAKDRALIKFESTATSSFDFGLDSYKLRLGHETVSMGFRDSEQKIMHVLATNEEESNVDFIIDTEFSKDGRYSLAFNKSGETFDGYFLLDRFLNKYIDLEGAYEFDVTASAASREDRFVLTKNKKISSAEEERLVDIYPNPVKHILTVDVLSEQVKYVEFLNNMGQTLVATSPTEKRLTFEMNSLPLGMYFVKVVQKNHSVTITKVVKQ